MTTAAMNDPNERETAVDSESERVKSRVAAKRVWITVVAGLVTVGAIGGGAYAYTAHQKASLAEAKESFSRAVGKEAASYIQLGSTLTDAKNDAKGCTDRVDDAQVCEELSSAITDAHARTQVTVKKTYADAAAYDAATAKVLSSQKEIDSQEKTLSEARDAVAASVQVKAVKTAQKALTDATSAGESQASSTQSLIDDSEGQVADNNAVRQEAKDAVDALTASITDAQKLTESDDVDAINAATTAVKDKTTATADKHSALQTAIDEWKAAQTAAAATVDAGASSTQTQWSAPNAITGRATSAPVYEAPTYTQPAPAPAPEANNGGEWVDTSTGGNLCQQVDSNGNSWVGECP